MTQPALRILVLAAGQSRRMGGADKLMIEIDGVPLLARVIAQARQTPYPVCVTIPSGDSAKDALVRGKGALPLPVKMAAEGQAQSLQSYAKWAAGQPDAGVAILLGDMPDVDAKDIITLANAAQNKPAQILRGSTADGQPGHPVVIPAHLVPKLMELQGDSGAKELITRNGFDCVPLPGTHATTDLDTPQDWAAWQAARAGSSGV